MTYSNERCREKVPTPSPPLLRVLPNLTKISISQCAKAGASKTGTTSPCHYRAVPTRTAASGGQRSKSIFEKVLGHKKKTRECAKRWQHVLGPDVKHCSWTPEEDKKLLDAMGKFGNNWKQIGLTELPDRSTHDLRNRQVEKSEPSASLPETHDEEMASSSPDVNDEDESCEGDGDDVFDEGSECEMTDSSGNQKHQLVMDMSLLSEEPVETTELGPTSMIIPDYRHSDTFLAVPALELPGTTFNMFDPSCTPDSDWMSWLNSLENDTSVSLKSRPSWWDEGLTDQSYFDDSSYGSFDVNTAGISDTIHISRARKRVKGETSPRASLGPMTPAENPSKDNGQMGLVTLSLDQVDPIIANEIIGSVMKHSAGLKINCTVNNHP
ncbi:hypothetical protein CLIM01_00232 [Colletotrichum limetticola]|uniref:Myb-like domain-containing protein n=1 Tax=Colletotrichum limetticola TaxID=1209924 RepID=A0ABQ9QF04_9PEZI|nr:hypothetical protein CLIM01_00232 [Colletotrichum limetticola]